MVVEVKIGEKTFHTEMDKAKEIIRKYKKNDKEFKELAGATQILITVGGIALGAFAADVARRIASEIE